MSSSKYDVVIVGGTPAGITAALAAAQLGKSVLLLERTAHVGGLPANGLGATDIGTRGATGGLFKSFVDRVHRHYVESYGADSQQVADCSQGYHFEPSVGEQVLLGMLAEAPGIEVRTRVQFEAAPFNVKVEGKSLRSARVLDPSQGTEEWISGKVFVDATYEGDLAAAAGVRYRLGREGETAYGEPMAGHVFQNWGGPRRPESTGLGDNAIQAYNYRLPLTRDASRRVPIEQPASYRREEYVSIIEDLRLNRDAGHPGSKRGEIDWDGIGRITNMVVLPNGKTDANNQHAALLSTDLPEENWPWPTANWAWRDQFAVRLREYILGLIWFCQNDPELPEEFRTRCSEYGLCRDEYEDNGNFPRQVYVREGRRIEGEQLFSAHDALPKEGCVRPPIHLNSVTASHYALDSHACYKRQGDFTALEGFFSYGSVPYTVPWGAILPKNVDGLIVPVAASCTHIGFSTLRMEPCWMALGEAAGVAAARALEEGVRVRDAGIVAIQDELVRRGAVLFYIRDAGPEHPHFAALQFWGLRGLLPDWQARPDEPVDAETAEGWSWAAGRLEPMSPHGGETRGEYLTRLRSGGE